MTSSSSAYQRYALPKATRIVCNSPSIQTNVSKPKAPPCFLLLALLLQFAAMRSLICLFSLFMFREKQRFVS